MILWMVKLICSVRQAIAGRKYPHQLAWAVAFGLLLGVVPHGNLLAIAIVFVVLSLKINHAMAGLTAIAATFMATLLDPYSHEVGNFVLTHPQLGETAASAWQLPLIPWTDLNNTVVMGSFLIGVGALLPVFAVTYPVFRWLAPSAEPSDLNVKPGEPSEQETIELDPQARTRIEYGSTHEVILIDRGHDPLSRPHHDAQRHDAQRHDESELYNERDRDLYPASELDQEPLDFVEVEHNSDPDDSNTDDSNRGGAIEQVAVETRIDVIRMTDHRAASGDRESEATGSPDQQQPLDQQQQPMDEALNYLLRQLRDSQQRKAA